MHLLIPPHAPTKPCWATLTASCPQRLPLAPPCPLGSPPKDICLTVQSVLAGTRFQVGMVLGAGAWPGGRGG